MKNDTPMINGFARRKEQSKEDIRRAAEELFSKFGVDKVSVNDIARKAGVSQATIYNNFGSKDELVHDYHNIIVKKMALNFREIIALKKSWFEKLQSIMQSLIDVADRYKIELERQNDIGQLRLKNNHGSIKLDTTIRSEIEQAFQQFVQEGKEQGSLRSDVSDEAIVTYIRFFQQGIANNPAVYDKMRRDTKFSQDLLSLFIYGIGGHNS